MGKMETGGCPFLFPVENRPGGAWEPMAAFRACFFFMGAWDFHTAFFSKKNKKIFGFMLWKFFFVVYYT